MNTTAANQADRQIEPVSEDLLGDADTRWSTDDELLVWTVSRLEGGRRHGIERDCHVVYAMSPGFFVEQTRKFRASAEQCIEMLQRGKRAGTIQRKVALDSIIAVRSDARSGRLQIRTINGTHQLDPISNEEADVLREIATELTLRMPAGGAQYTDLEMPPVRHNRRKSDENAERHAIASLENARVEDAPDGYQAPQFVLPDDDVEHLRATVEDDVPQVVVNDRARIAAAVEAEPIPVADVEHLPADITVAGGVEITFEPAVQQAYDAAEQPQSGQPTVPEHIDQPVANEPAVRAAADLPAADPSERFDRRQQRAMRLQLEEGASSHDAAELHAAEQGAMEPSDAAQPLFDLPGAEQPQYDVADHSAAPSEIFAAPESPVVDALSTGEAAIDSDRRQADDPNFPSIFDRRGTTHRDAAEVPGWARFGDSFDDHPSDDAVSTEEAVSQALADESDEADVNDDAVELPAGPPTLAAPSGPPTVGLGGSVGFNPDFDVNPFR